MRVVKKYRLLIFLIAPLVMASNAFATGEKDSTYQEFLNSMHRLNFDENEGNHELLGSDHLVFDFEDSQKKSEHHDQPLSLENHSNPLTPAFSPHTKNRRLSPILSEEDHSKENSTSSTKNQEHPSYFAQATYSTPQLTRRKTDHSLNSTLESRMKSFQSTLPHLKPRSISASSTESSPGLLAHYRPLSQAPTLILTDLPLPPFGLNLSQDAIKNQNERKNFHFKMRTWKKENLPLVHQARSMLKPFEMIRFDLTCALYEHSKPPEIIDQRMMSFYGSHIMQEELIHVLRLRHQYICQGTYNTLPAFTLEEEFCSVKIGEWNRSTSARDGSLFCY